MRWTSKPPKTDGYYWIRWYVGSIAHDMVVRLQTMKGFRRPHVYIFGEWRKASELSLYKRTRWSDRAITQPKEVSDESK